MLEAAIKGTSGVPRHTKLTRYRCSLPGLAGFAGNRCTEPEVPSIGSRAQKLFARLRRKVYHSVAHRESKLEGSEQFLFFEGKKRIGLIDSEWRDFHSNLLLPLRVMQ